MTKITTLGILSALIGALSLAACGEDDDKGSESNEGCTYEEENMCESFAGAAEVCALLEGTQGPCSSDNLEGTCVYQNEGEPETTRYYYKGEGGAAWEDFGGTAEQDCDSFGGTYTAK